MGYWKKQFEKVAKKAIINYAIHYGSAPKKTAIVIMLDLARQAKFLIKVQDNIMGEVKFLHIYHGLKAKVDLTGMTMIIPSFISKTMVKLRKEHDLNEMKMNLQVRWDEEEIYIFLCDGTKMVKLLTDDEVFVDEQIAADLMREQAV